MSKDRSPRLKVQRPKSGAQSPMPETQCPKFIFIWTLVFRLRTLDFSDWTLAFLILNPEDQRPKTNALIPRKYEFRATGFELRVVLQALGFGIWGLGFVPWALGFGRWDTGFELPACGFGLRFLICELGTPCFVVQIWSQYGLSSRGKRKACVRPTHFAASVRPRTWWRNLPRCSLRQALVFSFLFHFGFFLFQNMLKR